MNNWMILSILLSFGTWISYIDIKKGVIKNNSLLFFLVAAIIINIFFTKAFVNFPIVSLLNIAFGVALAFVVWIFGLWSAADAKLFMVINVLFPVSFYALVTDYFPGLALFINSIIPLFLFLLFQIMVKTNFSRKKEALLKYLKPNFIIQFFLRITAVYLTVLVISSFIRIQEGKLVWFVFFFFIFWIVEQKLKIKLNYFSIFLILLIILFSLVFDLSVFSIQFLYRNLKIFGLFFFLYIFFDLGTPLFTRAVRINDLKEGMIPSEMILKIKESFVKRPINFFTFFSLLRQRLGLRPIIGFNPDGLNQEEVEIIRSLSQKELLPFEEIRISVTIPFAPILFLGGSITYFLKGFLIF
jgi:Flp pilus assembly protein protease CpaA